MRDGTSPRQAPPTYGRLVRDGSEPLPSRPTAHSISHVEDMGAVAAEIWADGRGATLAGELDLASYDKLSAVLEPLLDVDGDVSLDLADVTFVDSSAIRLFVRLQEARNGSDAALHLLHPQPHVARVLRVAGVSDLGVVLESSDA